MIISILNWGESFRNYLRKVLFSTTFHVHHPCPCALIRPRQLCGLLVHLSCLQHENALYFKRPIEHNLPASVQMPCEMVIDELPPASLAVAGGLVSSRLASRLTSKCLPAALVPRYPPPRRAARYRAQPPQLPRPFGKWSSPASLQHAYVF